MLGGAYDLLFTNRIPLRNTVILLAIRYVQVRGSLKVHERKKKAIIK